MFKQVHVPRSKNAENILMYNATVIFKNFADLRAIFPIVKPSFFLSKKEPASSGHGNGHGNGNGHRNGHGNGNRSDSSPESSAAPSLSSLISTEPFDLEFDIDHMFDKHLTEPIDFTYLGFKMAFCEFMLVNTKLMVHVSGRCFPGEVVAFDRQNWLLEDEVICSTSHYALLKPKSTKRKFLFIFFNIFR